MDFSIQNNPFLPLFQPYPPHDNTSTEKLVAVAQNAIHRTQLPPGADFLASLFTAPTTTSKTKSYPPQASFPYPPINPLLTSPSWFQQALSSSIQAGVLPLPPRLLREPCLPVLPPQSTNTAPITRKATKRLPPTTHPSLKPKSPTPDHQQFSNQIHAENLPFNYQPNWQAFFREQLEKTHLSWRATEMPQPLGSLQLQETGTLVPSLIAGEVIMGFNVWGEKRLCLPHLFRFVLNDVDLKAIDEACTQLQITCTTCSPAQLTLLHSRRILPPAVSSCGLIRKSDAERLIKYIRNRLDAPTDLSEEASDDSSPSSKQQLSKQEQRDLHQLSTERIATEVECYPDVISEQDNDKTIADEEELASCPVKDDNTTVLESKTDTPTNTDTQSTQLEKPEVLSTTLNQNSSPIPVIHECFGRQLGLVHPDLYTHSSSKCIECQTCHRLFATDQFVGHTHTVTEVENLNHWGFDSTNWRCYLRLYTGRRVLNCKTSHSANISSSTEVDKEPVNFAEVHRRLEQFKIKFAQPIKLPASLSAALRTIGLCASVAPIPPPSSLPLLGKASAADIPPLLSANVPLSPGGNSQRSSTSSLGPVPPPLPPSILSEVNCDPAMKTTGGSSVNNQCHLLLPQLTLRRLWAPNDGRIKVPPPPIPNVKRDWKELPKKLNTGPPLVLYSHRIVSRPNTSNYDTDFIPNVCLVPSLAVAKGSGGGNAYSGSGAKLSCSAHSHRRGRHTWSKHGSAKYFSGHSRTGSSSHSSTDRFHRSRHNNRSIIRSGSNSGNPRSCSSGSTPHRSPILRSCSNSSSGRSNSSHISGNRTESVESVTSFASSVSSTSSSCKSRSVGSPSTASSSRCSHVGHLFPDGSSGTSKTPALDHAIQVDTNMDELLDRTQIWKKSISLGSRSVLSAPLPGGHHRLRRVMSVPSLLPNQISTKYTLLRRHSLCNRRGAHSYLKRPHMLRRSFSLSQSLLDLRRRMGHTSTSRKHNRPSRLSKHHAKKGYTINLPKHENRHRQEYLARQDRALAAAKAAQGFARQITPGLWSRHFVNLCKNEAGPPDLPNARPAPRGSWPTDEPLGAVRRPHQPNPNSLSDITDNAIVTAADRPPCGVGSQRVSTPAFATPVLVTSPAKNSLPTAVLALEAIWSDLVRHISEYTVAVESKVGVAEARQRLFEQFINMQTCYATQIASLMGENQKLVEKLSALSNSQQSALSSTSVTRERNDRVESFMEGTSNLTAVPQCSADPLDRSNKRHIESIITSGGTYQQEPPEKLHSGGPLVNDGSRSGDNSISPSQLHSQTKAILYPHKSRKEPVRSPLGRRTLSFNLACTSLPEASQKSVDVAPYPTVITSKPRLYEPKCNNTRYNYTRSLTNTTGDDGYRSSSDCCPNNSEFESKSSYLGSAFERINRVRASDVPATDNGLVRQYHNSMEDHRNTSVDTALPTDLNNTAPDYPCAKSPSADVNRISPWRPSKESGLSSSTSNNRKSGYSRPWDSFIPDHRQRQRDENNPYQQHNKRSASHVQSRSSGHRYDDNGGEASCRHNNSDYEKHNSNSCTGDQHDLASPEIKRRTLMSPVARTAAQFSTEFNKSTRMSLKPTCHKSNH